MPIFSQLGRLDEAQRLIEDQWERLKETGEGASERAIDLVRMHIELAFKPNPVEKVREYLDQAARMAPDDDRVWLGRANLAVRTGAYDEAKRWLDACLARRAEDVAVWRAWLSWGIATKKVDIVERRCNTFRPAIRLPSKFMRVNAWLCRQRVMTNPNAGSWNAWSRRAPAIERLANGLPNWLRRMVKRIEPSSCHADNGGNRSASSSIPEAL